MLDILETLFYFMGVIFWDFDNLRILSFWGNSVLIIEISVWGFDN